MCITIYKPTAVRFPDKETLRTCFENNRDGAGFMVATGETVEIHKGFMEFDSFWKALTESRAQYGDMKAYVMHFRISTQGGIRADGCHPFPLRRDLSDLRELDTTCDIGVAHNGIITLTSGRGDVTYSDTMTFITDYLSLIIKDRHYWQDDDTLELIGRLCGSRLAILDSLGHCELIGSGWREDDGVWYSNDSYMPRVPQIYSYPSYGWGDSKASWYGSLYDGYEDYLNSDGFYEFPDGECPDVELGDASYCEWCANYGKCYGEVQNG